MEDNLPCRPAGWHINHPLVGASPPMQLGILFLHLKFPVHQHVDIFHNLQRIYGLPQKPGVQPNGFFWKFLSDFPDQLGYIQAVAIVQRVSAAKGYP